MAQFSCVTSLPGLMRSFVACCLVQILQLENNRLDVLPETLGDLPSLIKLDISTNSLRFLPASMVSRPSRQVLEMGEGGKAAGSLLQATQANC